MPAAWQRLAVVGPASNDRNEAGAASRCRRLRGAVIIPGVASAALRRRGGVTIGNDGKPLPQPARFPLFGLR